MSAAHHTPGPWLADKIEDRAAYNIFTPGRSSALLTLEPGKHDGADPRVSNVEADARLIASAPELLEALKKFVAWSEAERDHKGTTFWERLEMLSDLDAAAAAAIAKAEGGGE